MENINFTSLFKHWIHYIFAFPALQENSHQEKSDQIKILHLYIYLEVLPLSQYKLMLRDTWELANNTSDNHNYVNNASYIYLHSKLDANKHFSDISWTSLTLSKQWELCSSCKRLGVCPTSDGSCFIGQFTTGPPWVQQNYHVERERQRRTGDYINCCFEKVQQLDGLSICSAKLAQYIPQSVE